MNAVKSVDDYIASAPLKHQARLKELRALIKKTAPQARERISYAMPYYEYKGRLIYFALWKEHVGIYAITAPLLKTLKKDLEGYVLSKGTIQLPLSEKLQVGLVKKLVQGQMKLNEAAENSKRKNRQ
jgi:uncharacterized protein YdhG (YjbR/CyaY superfamily)